MVQAQMAGPSMARSDPGPHHTVRHRAALHRRACAVPHRAVPHRAVPSRAVPSRAEPCCAVPSRAVPCRTAPHFAVPCRTAPHRAVPCRAAPHCPVLCYTTPHRAVPHGSARHRTTVGRRARGADVDRRRLPMVAANTDLQAMGVCQMPIRLSACISARMSAVVVVVEIADPQTINANQRMIHK